MRHLQQQQQQANNLSEGMFQQLASPTHSQQQQQLGTATNNSSTLSELLGSGIISPHGLFMSSSSANQDSLNSLLLQNSNNNLNTLNIPHSQSQQSMNSNMCLDSNNISIEKLLQQVEMLNHQSNIVAPLPPNISNSNNNINNSSHHQHTQQVTINMDTNSVNSTWKMNGVPSPSDTSSNNFNQTNLQLLQLFAQQNPIPQQPSQVNIGMIDNLSESSILQLLQSSLTNQRMIPKNQQIMLNGNVNPQQQHVVLGSMNNHSSSSDAFSPSHQASIIINPNDFSTLISNSPQHALNNSSHRMQDLLKPVDLCAEQVHQHAMHSFASPNSSMETTTLQQGSVEEMLGETSKSSFLMMNGAASMNDIIEDADEKPQKGGKKKRTKKATKTPSATKKPTKKSKQNIQEITITVPQQITQQVVETSPSAIASISPNSNSNTTSTPTPQNGESASTEKKNEKFSRPLLKNETVLCENNKFKNNYFVFSGTPTGAGSRKKAARTHSISLASLNQCNLSQSGTEITSPAALTTPTSCGGGSVADISSSASLTVQGGVDGSKSPQHHHQQDNKWSAFVSNLSEGDRHSLMQALIASMVQK